MKKMINGIIFLLLSVIVQPLSAEESVENGRVKLENNHYLTWHANSKSWISIDNFWKKFTNNNNGLTWKASADYPPYNNVKEFDTFIIMTGKGNCLMQFYHSRWRRANDVKRWDDQFNDYAGCPFVFD